MFVEASVFKRRKGNSGRGVYTVNCTNTTISTNYFGLGEAESFFVSAINDNSSGTMITDNIITRNISWIEDNETDHGIYVHSFKNVSIINNTISGWPANSTGGSIKIRNGENGVIENNTMDTSGILMYVYENTPKYPYLKNIIIQNNNISIKEPIDDIYHGIGYWRNTSSSEFYEQSIRIIGNTLDNGTIKIPNPVDIDLFNYNFGGVFNNQTGMLSLVTGIDNSGNY